MTYWNVILPGLDDSIEPWAQDLYIDGLGPIGSYTYQVIEYICGEIRDIQSRVKKHKWRKKRREKIFRPIFRPRNTNSQTLRELDRGGRWLVPVANELWWVVAGNPTALYELLSQGKKLSMHTRIYRLKIRHVLACLQDPMLKDITELCSDPILSVMDWETKIWDIEYLEGNRLLIKLDSNTKLKDILCLRGNPLFKGVDETQILHKIDGIETHPILQYIAYETQMKDIKSVHSHPQAIAQCKEKLIELLGCLDTEVVDKHREWPKDGEAMICTALEWRDYYSRQGNYILMATRFQDDQRDEDEEWITVQWYSIFMKINPDVWVPPEAGKRWKVPQEYIWNIQKVIGTQEALEACKESIPKLDAVKRVEEKSTTCHIDELWVWEAVLCSEEAARGLKVLDFQFCPEENYTYFVMVYKWKKYHIPWITWDEKNNRVHTINPDNPWLNYDREQKLNICIIDLYDPEREEKIRGILSKERDNWNINILFEQTEIHKSRRMFTWIIDTTNMSHRNFDDFKKAINHASGDMKVLW